jgi:RHS repeat-associated protein
VFRVNLFTGELCLTVVDFYLPSQLPFLFSHGYRSQDAVRTESCFGDRWSRPYDYRLVSGTGKWQLFESSSELYQFTFQGSAPDNARPPFLLTSANSREWIVQRTADDTRFHFQEVAGRMPVTRIEDRWGNQQVFQYDSQGRLEEVIDPLSRHLVFRHDGDRLVQVVLERHGRHKLGETLLACGFDSAGLLAWTADRQGGKQQYQYDAGRLVAYTNAIGGTHAAEYDATGRCVRTWECNGKRSRRFDFDPVRRVTRVTNGLGDVTLHQFNEQGVEIAAVDALGERTEFLHDKQGRLIAEITPAGSPAAMYRQLPEQNSWSRIEASGATTTFQQDSAGRTVKIIDACGHEWGFAYDQRGSIGGYRTPLGFETGVQHDNRGNVRAVTYPDGSSIRLEYASDGTCTKAFSSDGQWNDTRFDSLGRIVSYESMTDARVEIEYGHLQKTVTLADHSTRRYWFDFMGNLVQFQNERGARWRFRHDPFGRLLQDIDPLGHRRSYEYDAEGRACAVIDQNGARFSSEFDPCGRITRQLSFDGGETLYHIGATGEIDYVVDATGRRQDLERDAAGFITSYSDAGQDVHTRTYDPLGRLTGSQDGDVVLQRAFDADGRCILHDVNGHQVHFELNWRDVPLRIASATHAVDFTYDVQSRLTSVRSDKLDLRIEYRDAERLQVTRCTGGIRIERRFNERNWLVEQTVFNQQEHVLRGEALEYDATGNLVSRRLQAGDTLGFVHNERGELTQVTRNGLAIRSYDYDPAGNRTRFNKQSYQLHTGNRLLASQDVDYQSDASGRVIERNSPQQALTLSYGLLGQLERTTGGSPGMKTYQHDAKFRRTLVETADGVERIVWAGEVPFEHTLVDGTRLRYVFHPLSGRPLAVAIEDAWYLIVTDHRGEATELIRVADQASAWRSDPLGFESDVTFTEPGLPFFIRGLGQIYDADTQLTYQRARQYDAGAGRFLTPDPLGPAGGLNLYQFCFNQPFQFVDPSGLCPPGTKEQCDELFDKIQRKREELEERWEESANPKRILPWDGAPPVHSPYPAAHVAADGTPIAAGSVSSGSVKSHIDQYEAVQSGATGTGGMNGDIQQYYCKGCSKYEDSARGNAMKQAAEWSSKQMHLPKYPPAPPSIASRVTQ